MNSKKNLNVPNLRFPEFSGEWEEKLLSNLMTFKNGLNASKEDYGSGYKFINVLDIINNDFIKHENIIGSVSVSVAEFKKNIVEYGDILFQRSSETREEVGQANVYLDKELQATFGGFVIRGKKKTDYNPIFLNYLLKTSSSRKEITSKSGGSTRFNVGQDTLSSVAITIASIPEQTKIASFLTKIEARIKTQSKIIEHQESLMKGFMKKILAQNLRFKDDDGNEYPEWEEKRLDDIGKFTSGIGFSNSEQGGKEGIPFLKVSDMNLDGNEKEIKVANNYVSTSQITNKKYKPITEYSIIFAKVGAAVFLERKRISRNFLIDNNMMSFTPSGNIQYIKYLFETIRLSKYAQTGALPSYNASDIKNIKIQLPSFKEQTKIANFLSSLDTKFEKEKLVLKQYQQQKKHLLQNLFI